MALSKQGRRIEKKAAAGKELFDSAVSGIKGMLGMGDDVARSASSVSGNKGLMKVDDSGGLMRSKSSGSGSTSSAQTPEVNSYNNSYAGDSTYGYGAASNGGSSYADVIKDYQNEIGAGAAGLGAGAIGAGMAGDDKEARLRAQFGLKNGNSDSNRPGSQGTPHNRFSRSLAQ